jgi:hypothetical protein
MHLALPIINLWCPIIQLTVPIIPLTVPIPKFTPKIPNLYLSKLHLSIPKPIPAKRNFPETLIIPHS